MKGLLFSLKVSAVFTAAFLFGGFFISALLKDAFVSSVRQAGIGAGSSITTERSKEKTVCEPARADNAVQHWEISCARDFDGVIFTDDEPTLIRRGDEVRFEAFGPAITCDAAQCMLDVFAASVSRYYPLMAHAGMGCAAAPRSGTALNAAQNYRAGSSAQ